MHPALQRFDAYFRSANSVPPNARISVPTADWWETRDAVQAELDEARAELQVTKRLCDAKLAHQYRTIESMHQTAAEALEREAVTLQALQDASETSLKPLGYLALGTALGAVLALLVPFTVL